MSKPSAQLENNPSGHSSENGGAPKITVNDIDRTKTSDSSHTELAVQPLNRDRANAQLGEINERHKSDPMRASEIARDPYRVPDSQTERNRSLNEHRETITSTGFAGAKTYTDAQGNQLKGFESHDKGSGRRTFFGESPEGGYRPYHVQDGGRVLQPLDSQGKPAGVPLQMHLPSAHRFESYDGNPAATPVRIDRDPGIKQIIERSGEPVYIPGSRQQTHFGHEEPGPHPGPAEFRLQQSRSETHQGPIDANPHPPRIEVRPGPIDAGNNQPQPRIDMRPGIIDAGPHPPRIDLRPGIIDAGPHPPRIDLRPGTIDAVPHPRADVRQGVIDANAQALLRIDQRAGQVNANPFPLRPGQAEVNLQAFRFVQADPHTARIEAPLAKGHQEAYRIELRGHLIQNLHQNPELLLNIHKTLLAQPGDFSGKLPQRLVADIGIHQKPMDAEFKPRDGKSMLAAAEVAGRQMAGIVSLLGRQQQTFERVPGAEQSRLALKEVFRQPQMDQSANQNLAQAIQMQRFLNLRGTESGVQVQSFALRSNQAEALRDILQLIKSHDILGANTRGQENRAQENRSQEARFQDIRRGPEITSSLPPSARIQDALANATQRADATRRSENQTTHVDPSVRHTEAANHHVVVQPERISEEKAEGSRSKNESNDGRKAEIADKKHDEIKERDDKKQGGRDRELSPEEIQILLFNKLKELKQRELEEKEKQKEKVQDKDKKDPGQKTRWKYRIKEGDTLSALAARYLNDPMLAPAIFHINKSVIPVTIYDGKSYAVPPVQSVIWMPSDDDIELFSRSGAAKKYERIGFEGVKYASAQEELIARFGRRWYSSDDDVAGARAPGGKAGIDRAARRANIENVLGPLTGEKKKFADGRARYTVRLGESLKSIALRHPLVGNVEAWKLLAAINGLSPETDQKGCPLAVLKRGMVISLPTKEEFSAFLRNGALPAGALKMEVSSTLAQSQQSVLSCTVFEAASPVAAAARCTVGDFGSHGY